ncbi:MULTISPECIES: TonB-dependent siderophore receptor [unclassified Kaistella]|uniref:TonB-dependent siderophore receptor n=1 Tax=unclassified Kaistella TaxID=2762626 RepID=UPI0027350496|nr:MULTISPECIES: TonB-dependent siderophore receptor [unclassified Kaistella]MDP2453700.1 TonB-dependent siderophore receptor [Kaistella sp. SH11-4b]MDP2456757.1 TonB-dependent siderophore receptor [Kaistella sp. SH40-3]MDP2459513.1 TonB-dependent siderophore receptor [Kaistella sp. SH19-2b]
MKKQIISLGALIIVSSVSAQMKFEPINDTIRIQQIEDINMHKTGNPNIARPLSSKSNLTIMENPQPVAIVTHEIIEQQQAKQLSDVLQNVNGLYITSSRGNSQDSFGGRGFNFGNDNIFKNGARVNSGVFPEVSGLERVEVLKGGNAMLYGNVAAGGVVNLITKKPRFTNGGSIGLSGGSWNTYKPTVDFYGPLSEKVAFRVNGAYETADSFRDVVSSTKYYFNPSFLFNIGRNSQLIVEADYLKNDFTPDFGIGSITNKDGSYSLNKFLPRNAFLGTDWQYQNVQQATTGITFNHQFNDIWTLNAVASYQNYTKDYFSTERVQWSYDAADRLNWKRPLNKSYNEQNYTSLQVNLNGEFKTGTVNHKILVGTDGDYGTADSYTYLNPANGKTFGTSYLYGTNGAAGGTLYLDDAASWASGAMPDSMKKDRNRIPTQRFGIYAQDYIELSDKFKVLAGLRWSYIENKESEKVNFADGKLTTGEGTVDRAFSPKAGLVYMPNDQWSLFATYTNSFSANTGRDINDNSLKPSLIDQFEIGMKHNFWNNAVALNLSVYQIENRNFYQTAEFKADGSPNVDSTIKDFAGKMRSQGVELDITGNPYPNLSIIAGASYNHSVYLDTPADFGYVEDQRLVRTPATTANASIFYTFTDYVKGLKLGASVYYVGDRLAGWNDTKATNDTRGGITRLLEVDDYITAAISVGYDWKKFSVMGKIGNLFDTVNYNYHENYSVNPITPRNFYMTLTYKL